MAIASKNTSDGPMYGLRGPCPPPHPDLKTSMYIYIEVQNFVPKIYILAPSLKILFKLAHEIKTENLFDHSCIPFAQEKQKP